MSGFLVGMLVGMVTMFFAMVWARTQKRLVSVNVESGHLPPHYYGYSSGFASLTTCQACGRIGLYEDQHPVKPCKACGGEVSKDKIGRWAETHWELKEDRKEGP